MSKKCIGICIPKDMPKDNSVFVYPFYWCFETIVKMVVDNNCIPMFLQYEGQLLDNYLDMIDGLVLPGDRDIHPKYYGEELKEEDEKMGLMADVKMDFQIEILKKILLQKQKQIPILGICAGMQSMNVAMGGTLIQDIETEINTNIEHRQGKRTLTEIAHYIDVIDKNSFLFKATEEEHFGITSNHHQAIKKLGDGFKITALSSKDKIVEAIEFEGDSFCVGIQWHPERYATDNDKKIIQHFFKMC